MPRDPGKHLARLSDVLRIYSGDFTPGQIGGVVLTQAMLLGVAVLMAVPIITAVLSLVLDGQILRAWDSTRRPSTTPSGRRS